MTKSSLLLSKNRKNDEFYTRLEDIEHEVKHYKQHFYNKVVFCNCDNPFYSNFFKHFLLHFNSYHIKKLIAISYKDSAVASYDRWLPKKKAYRATITNVPADIDENIDKMQIKSLFLLKGNLLEELVEDGSFLSDESVSSLKESDIVCSNSPFSLFREYIQQLIEYNKHFLIIGNMNAVGCKDIFPLIRDNKLWFGYNLIKEFLEPGNKHKKFGNICWYTNLEITKRYIPITLTKSYYKNPEFYPCFHNFKEAINVNRVSEIPIDYHGIMGVPLSYIYKHNPEQFEIIGIDRNEDAKKLGIERIGEEWISIYKKSNGKAHITANMHNLVLIVDEKPVMAYKRLLIKRKQKS